MLIVTLTSAVALLTKLVDDNWAIEISEIHHKEKKDHPSGTALALGNSVAKGKKIDLDKNKVIDDPITDAADINLTKIRKNVVCSLVFLMREFLFFPSVFPMCFSSFFPIFRFPYFS